MAKQKLPNFDETVAAVGDFLKEFQKETDRGTALVGAAYLDDLLRGMLEKYFVEDAGVVWDLLGTNGPLGTFSSRINLAYCLGFLWKDQFEDLHIIRKVRNEFAHVHTTASFESAHVMDLTRKIQQLAIVEKFKEQMSATERVILLDGFKTARQKFVGNLVHLAVGIMTRGIQLNHQLAGRGFQEEKTRRLPFERPHQKG